MSTKNAQDLKVKDKFLHNEIKPWEVISTPAPNRKGLIMVLCQQENGTKTKVFEFGKYVSLDIIN